MSGFVKHFVFWVVALAIVGLSVMLGVNSAQEDTANAVVDGLVAFFLLVGVYFVFCTTNKKND